MDISEGGSHLNAGDAHAGSGGNDDVDDYDDIEHFEKWKNLLKADQDVAAGKFHTTHHDDSDMDDVFSGENKTDRGVHFVSMNNSEEDKFVHEETLHNISGNLDFDTRIYKTEFLSDDVNAIKRKLLAASYTSHGADIRALFRKMDKDNSRSIDTEELGLIVKKILPNVKDEAINSLMAAVDLDGSGTIEEEEFIEFIGDGKTGISDKEKRKHKKIAHVAGQKQKQLLVAANSATLKQVRNKLKAVSYSAGGAKIGSLFDKFDTDGNGEIDLHELQSVLKKMLPDLTSKELRMLMNVADVDGNGVIDREEFISFVTGKTTPENTPSPPSAGSSDRNIQERLNIGAHSEKIDGTKYVKSPQAVALEKTIEDLELQLEQKRSELQKIYDQGPESHDTVTSLQQSSPNSYGSACSQYPKGFSGKDVSRYGIHKESWKVTTQRPRYFQEKHRPIFVEDDQIYDERAKSLPKRKSMAECIDKSVLQVNEVLKTRVVDSVRNRKLGLAEKSKPINVRTLKSKANGTEIRMAPKIVVRGRHKNLELHAGNIVSHIRTNEISTNSKGTGEDTNNPRIGSKKNLSPLRTPSPVNRRKTITTIRANNYDVATLGRKGFATSDGTVSMPSGVLNGARTI